MQTSKKIVGVLRDFLDESIHQSEIDWIICAVTNKKRNEILHDFAITPKEEKKIFKIAKKRSLGIPLCQILGNADFYGLEFYVNKNVLIPRFETELLVESVIKLIPKGNGLDLGTGSGAIAITLKKLHNLDMDAVDLSKKAIKVAKKNAKNLNVKVRFFHSNLFAAICGQKYDFIVSNPPYIKSEDIPNLQVEVKDYEPHIALDGGNDGYDFYRKIIADAPKYLKSNAKIFFEIGIGQSEEIKKMLEKDFKDIVVVQDYSKIDRIIYATLRR